MAAAFLDSGFLIALALTRDQRHAAAQAHWDAFLTAPYALLTTSFVFDEVTTFLNGRDEHAAAVEMEAHRITGLRKTKTDTGKTDYVADASSDEGWWARFYDVQTARPMFAGAQDGIVYSTFAEMAATNKVAYDFYAARPRDVLEKEMPRWRKRIAKEK